MINKRYYISQIVMVIDAVMYLVMAILSRNLVYIDTKLLILVGQANFMVLGKGWWWQLITAIFVHVTLLHLVLNLFYLYLIGIAFERSYGSKFFIITFIVSGISGNIMSLALGPMVVTAGASGAIFGLIGAMTMITRARYEIKLRDALIALFLLLAINSMWQGVNSLAHLGGLIAGIVLGIAYDRKHRRTYYYGPWHY